MAVFLAIPVLTLIAIFQSAVISRATLLHGAADLLLLTIVAWALQERVKTAWHWAVLAGVLFAIYSALPAGLMLAAYLMVTGLALLLKRRVWRAPVLAMLVTVFIGTFLTHALSYLAVWAAGTTLPLGQTLNLITLPSLLLNSLLAGPVYVLVGDLANWVYPEEVVV